MPPTPAPLPAPPPQPDLNALQAWLAPRLGVRGALALQRLQGGQSNPTWLLREGPPGRAWVLRAKPAPAAELLPSAHAIEREFRVMQALRRSAVPVPPVRLLCEDEGVIGRAFYVMDFVEGRIFRDASMPGLPAAERAALHEAALGVLAALHGVDWRAAGLADYGRHDAYFERMLARWTRQYRACAGTELAPMERLIDWLPRHIPDAARAGAEVALIHGDFRIENLVFHPTEPRVLAVLDWELSTLGHPLADLAYHAMAWHHPPGVLQGFGGLDLHALGIPGERQTVEAYCRRRGRDDLPQVLAHWNFYLACNLFRLVAILTGIARRVADGTAAHRAAHEISRMAGPVAELGWSQARSAPRLG